MGEWKSKSKHGTYKAAPGFSSGAARLPATANTAPAPGAYESRDLNKIFRPLVHPVAPFGATDARLQAMPLGTPGPGRYQLAPTWQKRSFNISLDDTVLC